MHCAVLEPMWARTVSSIPHYYSSARHCPNVHSSILEQTLEMFDITQRALLYDLISTFVECNTCERWLAEETQQLAEMTLRAGGREFPSPAQQAAAVRGAYAASRAGGQTGIWLNHAILKVSA